MSSVPPRRPSGEFRLTLELERLTRALEDRGERIADLEVQLATERRARQDAERDIRDPDLRRTRWQARKNYESWRLATLRGERLEVEFAEAKARIAELEEQTGRK